jgi:hypothetical protein
MRWRWFCVAVLLMGTSLRAVPVSPHAQKAVETIRQLREIGVPKPDETSRSFPVPASVTALLRTLNHELEALLMEELNDASRPRLPNEEEILDDLRKAGWQEIPPNKWAAYGEIKEISYNLNPDYRPGILIVTTQLWLPYDDSDPDAAVYVFQGEKRNWELVLKADADFGTTSDGRLNGMQSKISPPDSEGKWFLVVAHVPPSQRMEEHFVQYEALRPGKESGKPVVLVSRRDPVNSAFQPPFELSVYPDSFQVKEGVERKLDGQLGTVFMTYEIDNYGARRVGPLGESPVDFLDQWVQAAWDDAKRWSEEKAWPALVTWHERLDNLAADSAEVTSMQPCPRGKQGDEEWVIELAFDAGVSPVLGSDQLYVEVARKDDDYRLVWVETTRPKGCDGKTPLTPAIGTTLP